MANVKMRSGGNVGFNMTPMIDIVFNLIIFFMLVSQFYRLSVEEVKLPPASQADPLKRKLAEYTQLVVNIVPPTDPRDKATRVVIDGGTVATFVEGGDPPNMQPLIDLLKNRNDKVTEMKQKPMNVICRAGEEVTYDIVGSVMIATSKAGIKNWWVQAARPPSKGGRAIKEFLGVANGSGEN
ncbi:MAG: biopolymer transporter ExbD [Planctomycetes bacterium]|nr:biopolymer transporter ExbD [Planctomycetota bacterium]